MNTKFKVAFVDFSNNFSDKHSIYCLSAYLKSNGIETHYINNGGFLKTISNIERIRPDLLLYSAYSTDMLLFIEFDKIMKQKLGIKSIIGGVGPTFDWKILKGSSIDAFCVGEGEYALVDFIKNRFSSGRNISQDGLPSEYFPFIDINNVPFPDRELVYKNDYVLRNMPSKQFLAGRGCPYLCTYCHNHIQNKMFKKCGPLVRKKSVSYLIDEINDVRHRYPLRVIVFQDDTFILKKKWLFEFCERFPKEVGFSYTCNIRANLIDEETIKALNESNCACVYWSIESGNDFIRNNLLKRQMSKEQILDTAALLRKYKIPYRNGGMVGLPGEKFEEILETLELNIKTKPKFGFASIFIPFPGLELTNYALKHNYLSEKLAGILPKSTHHDSSSLNFTADEKLKIQKITYLYPIFVNYPMLFYNHKIFNLLLKLPLALLRIFFNLFCGYKLSRLYKVRMSFLPQIAIIWRYFRNPF